MCCEALKRTLSGPMSSVTVGDIRFLLEEEKLVLTGWGKEGGRLVTAQRLKIVRVLQWLVVRTLHCLDGRPGQSMSRM